MIPWTLASVKIFRLVYYFCSRILHCIRFIAISISIQFSFFFCHCLSKTLDDFQNWGWLNENQNITQFISFFSSNFTLWPSVSDERSMLGDLSWYFWYFVFLYGSNLPFMNDAIKNKFFFNSIRETILLSNKGSPPSGQSRTRSHLDDVLMSSDAKVILFNDNEFVHFALFKKEKKIKRWGFWCSMIQ